MKTFISFLSALVLGTFFTQAATTEEKVVTTSIVNYGKPFIFVEDGITFSVYQDGEFDFYIDNRVGVGANVNFGNTNITFNSGYNYDPYVQYDDYGAVIQVENVPIYYDYYGRVSQIGDINIWYRNGRVNRIGGMYVYYNPRGIYTHFTGYVNIYNRYYVYRPWHGYFVRPAVGFCLVYNRPYRKYYHPIRYTYYRPYAYNTRRTYARVGHDYRYDRAPRRESIYRNDKRVAVRDNGTRRSASYRSNTATPVRREAVSGNKRSEYRTANNSSARTTARSNGRPVSSNDRSIADRGNSNAARQATRSETPRSSRSADIKRERTVTQRSVTRSPQGKTVSRSSSSVSRPANGKAIKTHTRSERTVSSRTSTPVKSRGEIYRSSAKRSSSNAPARTSRSAQGVRERSKSSRVH